VKRYRVLAEKVEVRVHGVLQNAYYGEAVTLDESAARPLVEAGSLAPVPDDGPA
jgi:hypothetical protein